MERHYSSRFALRRLVPLRRLRQGRLGEETQKARLLGQSAEIRDVVVTFHLEHVVEIADCVKCQVAEFPFFDRLPPADVFQSHSGTGKLLHGYVPARVLNGQAGEVNAAAHKNAGISMILVCYL